MGLIGKVLFGAVALLFLGVGFMATGLAFSINQTLLRVLQGAMVILALIGIGLAWTGRWRGAAGALFAVALVLMLVLVLNR
jgi:hypothetical protein